MECGLIQYPGEKFGLVDLFLQSRNWAFGSAVAMTLVIIMLITITLYMKLVMGNPNQRKDVSLL